MFGVMLFLFAQTTEYGVALGLLAFSGTCAGIMDTLGQTLMQRNAGEQRRGAAMGLWVFSIGTAPVGSLGLGASAAEFGAPATLSVSGGLLAMVGVLLALNRRLRKAP
jgi:MFS family permease